MNKKHRFPIGTQYKTRGKHPKICTVTDQLTVTNSKGEIIKTFYHSEHEFINQTITDYDVIDTTIAIGACSLQGVSSIDELDLSIYSPYVQV